MHHFVLGESTFCSWLSIFCQPLKQAECKPTISTYKTKFLQYIIIGCTPQDIFRSHTTPLPSACRHLQSLIIVPAVMYRFRHTNDASINSHVAWEHPSANWQSRPIFVLLAQTIDPGRASLYHLVIGQTCRATGTCQGFADWFAIATHQCHSGKNIMWVLTWQICLGASGVSSMIHGSRVTDWLTGRLLIISAYLLPLAFLLSLLCCSLWKPFSSFVDLESWSRASAPIFLSDFPVSSSVVSGCHWSLG
jgi:hypothetical protein